MKTLESNTNDKNEINEVKIGINELKESMKSVCGRIEEKELHNNNELKTYVHDKIQKLVEKYKNHKHKDINDKIEVIV